MAGDPYVYMVSPDGGGTSVTQLSALDRRAMATRSIGGRFELPAGVGKAPREGLSRDGRTLVLAARPRSGTTRFALIDTRGLMLLRVVALPGVFSYDAMSPDGSTLYVIRYLSSDRRQYAVQAMDTSDARPTLHTVVEKGEPGEQMSGLPISRATSPSGNWVYTLYDGAGKTPFVHALSTADRFTMCIDLDALAGRADLTSLSLKLSPNEPTLNVTGPNGKPVALINTESFEVTEPPATATTAPRKEPTAESDSTNAPKIIAIALAAGLLLAALAAVTRQARRSSAKHA
jgi:DNA-binding beta-propeller fold protein YncE